MRHEFTHDECVRGGINSGQIAVASGRMELMLSLITPESMVERGTTQGRKNIETGHVQRMGRAQGRRNVESGHLERIKTPEVLQAGGRAAGKIAVESGQIHTIKTPESCAKGGSLGCHTRWHVSRKVKGTAPHVGPWNVPGEERETLREGAFSNRKQGEVREVPGAAARARRATHGKLIHADGSSQAQPNKHHIAKIG
jgi:hypothetical protein